MELSPSELQPFSASSNSDSEDVLTLPTDDNEENYEPTPKKKKGAANPAARKSMAGTSSSAIHHTPAGRQRKSNVSGFNAGLRALSIDQLVDLIEKVIEKHPEIKNEFVSLTPLPDLTPLEKKLEILKKNIDKSFPWTKYGSGRDAFCFRRVKTHLDTFQRECIQQCKSLIDCQQLKSAIEYIIIAWKYVDDLPDWDDPKHNKHKVQCYKKLSSNLINSLKKTSFNKQELQGNIARFKKFKGNGMQDCIKMAETILSKLK